MLNASDRKLNIFWLLDVLHFRPYVLKNSFMQLFLFNGQLSSFLFVLKPQRQNYFKLTQNVYKTETIWQIKTLIYAQGMPNTIRNISIDLDLLRLNYDPHWIMKMLYDIIYIYIPTINY